MTGLDSWKPLDWTGCLAALRAFEDEAVEIDWMFTGRHIGSLQEGFTPYARGIIRPAEAWEVDPDFWWAHAPGEALFAVEPFKHLMLHEQRFRSGGWDYETLVIDEAGLTYRIVNLIRADVVRLISHRNRIPRPSA